MRDLRIIFMGTPEFAVESLKALADHGFNIVGVITAPDKPQGRGQKLAFSPVKEFAVSLNIPVLQPTNLKSPDFHEELKSYQANLFVVVAFRMLPEVVWSMPEYGTFNLHASLLPHYRGAAPINWAIINGETETGVTTFFIKHEIDTGNIIMQEQEPIHESDNAGALYKRLMVKGARLVVKTVEAIRDNSYKLKVQKDSENIHHAPKLFKENCEIDWSKSSRDIFNFVRGLAPYPAAWTQFHEKIYKVYEVQVTEKQIPGKPGNIVSTNGDIYVKTGDGAVSILDLQAEGKKRMKTAEFLRGNKL
jgi:methionyl-tRNA formyltransferase